MTQSNGWRDQAIQQKHVNRTQRVQQLRRLRDERIYDEWTRDGLIEHMRRLKADMYTRTGRTP